MTTLIHQGEGRPPHDLELADFLAIPGAPTPKRLITVGDILPPPKSFRRTLRPAPRSWGTYDIVALCALTALISATLMLLVIPR